MKNHIILLAIALCCVAALSAQTPNTTTATNCKPIIIKFLGFRDEYGSRVRGSSLRDMLECVHNKQVIDRYKTSRALDWVGTGLLTVGSILVTAAGLSPDYEYSDEQLKLAEIGLKTMGVGLGVDIGGLLLKKSAVNLYNRHATGTLPNEGFSSPSTIPNNSPKKNLGFAFGKTYYKWGIDRSEAIYINGFLFDNNSETANSGFYLSLFSEKKILERIQGRTEFSWAQRGFGLSMRGSDGYYDADTKTQLLTNYLEAAWLAQFVANPSKPGILLSAGPGIGFLTGVKIKSKATVRDTQTGESQTASDATKGDLRGYSFGDRLDYGLHLGAGARWPIGNGQLCFDIRYFLGLKNVNDDPYSSEKAFNRGWSLGLGYAGAF